MVDNGEEGKPQKPIEQQAREKRKVERGKAIEKKEKISQPKPVIAEPSEEQIEREERARAKIRKKIAEEEAAVAPTTPTPVEEIVEHTKKTADAATAVVQAKQIEDTEEYQRNLVRLQELERQKFQREQAEAQRELQEAQEAPRRRELVEAFPLQLKKEPSTLYQDTKAVVTFNKTDGDIEDVIYHFDKLISNIKTVMNSFTTEKLDQSNAHKIHIGKDDQIYYKPFDELRRYFEDNSKFTTEQMEQIYANLRKRSQPGKTAVFESAVNRMQAIASYFNEKPIGDSLASLADKAMKERSGQFKGIIDPKNMIETTGLLMVNSDEMFQVGHKFALLEYNAATQRYSVNLHNFYQYLLYETWWQVYFNDNSKIELWRKGVKTPYGYVNWLDIFGDNADPKYTKGEDISLLEAVSREYGQSPDLKELVTAKHDEVMDRFRRLMWVVISGGNNNWNNGWGIWSGEVLDAEKFFEGPLQEAYASNEMAKTNREIYWFNLPGSTKKEVNAFLLGKVDLINFDGSLGKAFQRNTLAYNNITELTHGRLFTEDSNFDENHLNLRLNYQNTCLREIGPKGHMELFRSLQRKAIADADLMQTLREKNASQEEIKDYDDLTKDIKATREEFLEKHSDSEEDFTEADRRAQGVFSLFELLYRESKIKKTDEDEKIVRDKDGKIEYTGKQYAVVFEKVLTAMGIPEADRKKLQKIVDEAINKKGDTEALKALEVYFTINLLRSVSNIKRADLNFFDTSAETSKYYNKSKVFMTTAFAEACQFEDNIVHKIDTDHLSEYSLAIAWFFGLDVRNDTAASSNKVFTTRMLFLMYNLAQHKHAIVGSPQTFLGLKGGLTFLEAGTVEFLGEKKSLIEWMRMNIRGEFRENKDTNAIKKEAEAKRKEQEKEREEKLDTSIKELKKDTDLIERVRIAIFNRLLLLRNPYVRITPELEEDMRKIGENVTAIETFITNNTSEFEVDVLETAPDNNSIHIEKQENKTLGGYLAEEIERLIRKEAEKKLNEENEKDIQKILAKQYKKKGYKFIRGTMKDYWDHHLRGLFDSAQFFSKIMFLHGDKILKRDKGVLVLEHEKDEIKVLYGASRELLEKSPVEWEKARIVERLGPTKSPSEEGKAILTTGVEVTEEKEDVDTLHRFSTPLYASYTSTVAIDKIDPNVWYGQQNATGIETLENIVLHDNVISLGREIAEETRKDKDRPYKVGTEDKPSLGVVDARGLLGYGIQTTLRLVFPTIEDIRDTNTYVEPWDPGEVLDFIEFVENYMGEVELHEYEIEGGGEVKEARRKRNRGVFTPKEMQPILRRAKATKKRLFVATVGGGGLGALLQMLLRALGLTSQHAMK